jgi:hypothetical protein
VATIGWSWSQTSPTTGYQDWVDEPLDLQPGSAVWIRVFATGGKDDDSADRALANLVVPASVHLTKFNQKSGDYEHAIGGSYNEAVGDNVAFVVGQSDWYPDFCWMSIYLVIVPEGQDDFTLLYSVTTTSETTSTRTVTVG